VRLFVALWPPAEVIGDLAAATSAVAARGPAFVRWSGSEQFHVTLAFLGEVPDRQRGEIERRLARVSERHAPLSLQLAGAGRFGDRVLYVRIDGDRDRLRRLAGSVTAAVRRAGVDVEERAFRPHLTVARARPPGGLRPLATALEGFRSADWTACELHLVSSRLGAGPAGRAAYETVAAWPLTGRGTPLH
jgi:2'-5' RNA ligase